MATKTLTGTDWNTAGHWNPSGVPVANDDAFLGIDSPALTTGPTGTNQDVKLASLVTHPRHKYAVASSGSPLIISATKILIQHSGDFYFQCHGGGVSNKTNNIIVRCPALNLAQKIEIGKEGTDPGDIDFIELLRGNVRLTNPTGVDELKIDHVSNLEGDVRCQIDSGAATIPVVRAKGGQIECSAVITNLHVDGALWTQLLGAVTNLYGGSGTVRWNSTGTLTRGNIGGTCWFDLTDDLQVKTVTELNLYGRARYTRFANSVLHAVAALNDYRENN